MRFLPLLLLLLIAAAPVQAHQLPEKFTGFEDPASCAGCHEKIYREWEGSMHAKSSKFADPVHSAVFDTFSKAMAAGKPAGYFCANCHMPTAGNIARLMSGEAAPDPADESHVRGITCSFCHKADGLVEGERFNSCRMTEGIKGKGGSDAPHGSVKSEFATTFAVCLGCHGKMVNAKGAVICSVDEEGYSDCLACHMPDAEGAPAAGSARLAHASHALHGARDAESLKKGAGVELGREMGRLLVLLKNPNPHYFPSTNPMRVAYVKVEITDAGGKTLFVNFAKDPSEDPKALFIKVFKAGDKVGAPTWEADGVAKDSRLKGGETRAIAYDIPDGAARATAGLYYRFVPPAAMEKFGIKPDGVVEAEYLVSEAELAL
ncbi:MAG TPA: multiheme c-type cytochrome [Nitrospirota bacterium]|nr:multiheme c-type cytochrome [Nitrospirota bacterium]